MLDKFRKELIELLTPYSNPRPFICEGNPLVCEVFIVGINAATELNKGFWEFWSNDIGFNKKQWLETYFLERSMKPLKRGKTRRNKISNTRQRIEWLVQAMMPIKTLETNIFVRPTETAKELTSQDRETAVFEFLIQTIRPKVIFTHGKEVKDYLEKFYDLQIVEGKVNRIQLYGIETKIISMHHLSRGWSKQQSIEIGELIKSSTKDPSTN